MKLGNEWNLIMKAGFFYFTKNSSRDKTIKRGIENSRNSSVEILKKMHVEALETLLTAQMF